MSEKLSIPENSPEPVFLTEQSAEFWAAENQLREMRNWRRCHDDVFKRFDISDEYWQAEEHLKQIYRIYQVEPENNPKPLLYNFVKYLEATNREGKVDLDFHFLSRFCEYYLEDVDFFKEIGFRRASNIAIYHHADSFRNIKDFYADHDFITTDDIKRSFGVGIKDPALHLQNLERNVADFKENFEPAIRLEYNYPGGWSLFFVRTLFVRQNDPYSAARNIISMSTVLRDKYPYAELSTVETWSKQLVTKQPTDKARAAERLLDDIPTELDPSEEALKQARTDLENLRLALPEGLSSGSNPKTIDVQRLAMIFKLNWRESFEGLDLLGEARHFYYTALRYNRLLDDRQSYLRISTDLENLYSIFRVFALDVAILRQEGPERAAAHVAKYHSPGIYDEYRRRYRERHPLLTDRIIIYHIINTPRNIDRAIENWITKIDGSSKRVGALAIPEVVPD